MTKRKIIKPLTEAQVKSALRFAKKRGLTYIDLRKPLNTYRRNLAKKYFEASLAPSNYVAVSLKSRPVAAAMAQRGELVGSGKILLKKKYASDTFRIVRDKKSKKPIAIKRSNPYYADEPELISLRKSPIPHLKPGEVYYLPLGSSGIEFETFEDMMAHMSPYEQEQVRSYHRKDGTTYTERGNFRDWEKYVEVRPA